MRIKFRSLETKSIQIYDNVLLSITHILGHVYRVAKTTYCFFSVNNNYETHCYLFQISHQWDHHTSAVIGAGSKGQHCGPGWVGCLFGGWSEVPSPQALSSSSASCLPHSEQHNEIIISTTFWTTQWNHHFYHILNNTMIPSCLPHSKEHNEIIMSTTF